MMSQKLFELLDITAKLCRRNSQPFGGIQVIFSGDFFQLPPVGTNGIPETNKFCFESLLWNETFPNQIQLTKIFRQNDDRYIKILNQIRVGKISKSSYQALMEHVGRKK